MRNLFYYRMPHDADGMRILSRRWTRKMDTFDKIFEWIEDEYNDHFNRYILINFHPLCKDTRKLKIRTCIFPRLSAIGTLATMPIFFIPNNR